MLGALDRRDFMKGAAALAGGVAAASAGPGVRRALAAAPDAPDPIANTVRRCVALGPNGVIAPGSSQDYDNNRGFLLDSGTKWVRLWADWPSLQPTNAAPSGSKLTALDRQIAHAHADGMKVILTAWRFPRWANGTASVTATQEPTYQLPDRASASDSSRRKELEFKLPADLSPTSAWGKWIAFLAGRYGDDIEFIELGNEPNLQVWPLQGPSATSNPYDPGPLTVHQATATMFETAKAVAGGVGLLGSSTADRVDTGSRLSCGYDIFTTALLDELDARAFSAGASFGWAHHNYSDVERDRSGAANRAAHVRSLLVGRWSGWPDGDAAKPQVFITEGGARLSSIASIYGSTDVPGKQAELVQHNWDRNYTTADGTGIAMVSQYLFYTDPNFDDGLCDSDGTKRPAFDTWAALPVVAEQPPPEPPPDPPVNPPTDPQPEPPASASPPADRAPTTTAAPATAAPPATVADLIAPGLALAIRRQTLANVLRRGLALDVSASESCRVEMKVALGTRTIGHRSYAFDRADHVRLRVRPRSRARRALRKARHPRLTITVAATDAAGNTRRVSRSFTPQS